MPDIELVFAHDRSTPSLHTIVAGGRIAPRILIRLLRFVNQPLHGRAEDEPTKIAP
jgi:hypothetical protein